MVGWLLLFLALVCHNVHATVVVVPMNRTLELNPGRTYRLCPNRTQHGYSMSQYLVDVQVVAKAPNHGTIELVGSDLLSSWLALVPAWNITLSHGVTVSIRLQTIARQWFDVWRGTEFLVAQMPLESDICVDVEGIEKVYLEINDWSIRQRSIWYLIGVVCWSLASEFGSNDYVQIMFGGLISVFGGIITMLFCVTRTFNTNMYIGYYVVAGSIWGMMLKFGWPILCEQAHTYRYVIGAYVGCLFCMGGYSVHLARQSPWVVKMLDVSFILVWKVVGVVLMMQICPRAIVSAMVTLGTMCVNCLL